MPPIRAMRTMNTEHRKDGRRTLSKNFEKDDVKPSEEPYGILKTLHDAALDRASEVNRGQKRNAEKPQLTQEQMIELRLRGQTEEAAREIAFQAREQIDFLNDVQNRVHHALMHSDEILHDDDPNATTEELKGKRWVESSRRMINGAVFRYNESCEERHEQLTAFCDWFELYENIWPLPLVQNDIQYNELIGKSEDQAEDEDADMEKVSALWPKMAKMREDLGHIMSVTSEMGQKALNAELREELTRQANKIKELQDMIEILQKALDAERKLVQEQMNEMSKMRNMHEVAINRRNEEIKQLKEQAEQTLLAHEEEINKLNEKFDAMVENFEDQIKEMRADHQRVVEDFEAQIAGLQENIAELEGTIVEKDQEIEIRDQSIEALTQNFDRLTKEHEVVKVQLGQVMEELKAERENPYVKRLEKKNAESMRAIASLEEQLDETSAKAKDLDEQLSAQTGELASLVEEKKKVDYDFKQQTVAYEATQKELTRVEKENVGQQQAMHALSDRLDRADEVLQKERERLQFLIDEEKQKADLHQAKLETVTKQKVDVETKLKFLSHDFEEKEAKLQEKARTMELKARAAEKKRKTEVEALEQEKREVQEALEAQNTEFTAAIAEQKQEYEAVLEEQKKELAVLRDFKAFLDAKVYADIYTQTDFAGDSGMGPAAGMGSPMRGAGGGEGEEIFFSQAQRIMKKFKTLREKVVEVRMAFEGENAKLKQVMANSLKQQAFKRGEIAKETAAVSGLLDRVANATAGGHWHSTAAGMEEEGAGNALVEELSGAVEHLVALAKGLVAQDQVQQELQDRGRGHLLEGIPRTVVELEHILEGVESCLSMSVVRPGSAGSSRGGSRPSSATVASNLKPLLAMAQARVEAQLAETTMDFSRLSRAEHNRLSATLQIMGPPPNALERIAMQQLQDANEVIAAARRDQGPRVGEHPPKVEVRARPKGRESEEPRAAKDLIRMEGHKVGQSTSPRLRAATGREHLLETEDAQLFASTGVQEELDHTKYFTRAGSPAGAQRSMFMSRRQAVGSREPPLPPKERPTVKPVVGLPFAGAPRLDTSNMRGRSPDMLSLDSPKATLGFDEKMVLSTSTSISPSRVMDALDHFQPREASPAARAALQQELKFRDPHRMASLVVGGHTSRLPRPEPADGVFSDSAADAEVQATMEPRSVSPGGAVKSPHGGPSRSATALSGQATQPLSRQMTLSPAGSLFPHATVEDRLLDTSSVDDASNPANPAVYHLARHRDGPQRPHSTEPTMLRSRDAPSQGSAEVFLPGPSTPQERSATTDGRPRGRFSEDFRASPHQLAKVAEIDAEGGWERSRERAGREEWAPEGAERRRQAALLQRAAEAGEVVDLSGPVVLEERLTHVSHHHHHPAPRRSSLRAPTLPAASSQAGGDALPTLKRRGTVKATAPPAHLVHARSRAGEGGGDGSLSPLKGRPFRSSSPGAGPQLASAFDPARRSLPPGRVIRAVSPSHVGGWEEDGRRTPERSRPGSASWSVDLVTEDPAATGLPLIGPGAGARASSRNGREVPLGETLQVQRMALDPRQA